MSSLLSGQITIDANGTAEQGPSTPSGSSFALKAHPDNSGPVWVGNDGSGDVTEDNGFPLAVGEGVVVDLSDLPGDDLSLFWFDGPTGAIVCWMRLG